MNLHTKGIYVVLRPDGTPIFETLAETAYSARSEAVRLLNRRWSELRKDGYPIARLEIVEIEALELDENQP